jgi:hypothetical protein
MSRHILRRPTSQLVAYPRQDDQPVIGLDRTVYHVLQDVHDPRPEYDPATHILSAAAPVIDITDPDGDDLNGTVTYGWILTPIVPPPPPLPPPDWLTFAGWLFSYPPMATAMAAARSSTSHQGEPATTSLPAAMDEARLRQNYAPFAAAWALFLQAAAMPADALAAIVAEAQADRLPDEFIYALQPTLLVRARNEDGTFRADDPATAMINEAWEVPTVSGALEP